MYCKATSSLFYFLNYHIPWGGPKVPSGPTLTTALLCLSAFCSSVRLQLDLRQKGGEAGEVVWKKVSWANQLQKARKLKIILDDSNFIHEKFFYRSHKRKIDGISNLFSKIMSGSLNMTRLNFCLVTVLYFLVGYGESTVIHALFFDE